MDDRDGPQDIDLADEGDSEDLDTIECPFCGASVVEGLPRCHQCGEWLPEDSPAARRARSWLWPVVVALLVAVILVMWHGLGRF
ncbi:MAG: hypothetical protein AMXMBFR13_02990 [Phycisphaerae bacterium]